MTALFARKSVRSIVMVTLGLFFLSACAYYNTLFNAKRSYKDGLEQLRENPDRKNVPAAARKSFETTIDKCWKLIELYTDKNKYADDALLYIAKSKYHLEKYTESRLHLEQFLSKYPDSDLISEAHLWYGKALLKDNEIEKSNEYFLLVINNSRDGRIRSQANLELGRYAFEQENYERCIAYLKKALEEKLDNEYKAELLYNLGEAYFIQKNYEEAVRQYRRVMKFSPALDIEYKSRLNLARAYMNLSKYEDSYHTLRRMLTAPRFRDFNSVIKTTMGENFERQNLLPDAVDWYMEVMTDRKRDVGAAQAAFNLANLYETHIHDVDSAVFYYGKVGQISQNFDSLEVARRRETFLREFKDIRDNIAADSRLVYRLTNEPSFLDSLYAAQFEDSLRIAEGLASPEDQSTEDSLFAAWDSTGVVSAADSLLLAERDSLRRDPNDPFNRGTGERDPFNRDNDPAQGARFPERGEEELEGIRRGDPPRDDENLTGNLPEGGEELRRLMEKNGQRQTNRGNRDANAPPRKKLEKRKLPQIEFDLMNNRYQLAEFYLLKVENYDSARYHFERFLATYEDSILTPKANYSLLYIYRQPGHEDAQRSDSLENLIIRKYPQSQFATELLRRRGLLEEEAPEPTREEKAAKLFLSAESLFFAGDLQRAIEQYQEVAQMDTTWDISAKAQYATAYIYEHHLAMTDAALSAYKRIISNYPGARIYVQVARKKTTPIAEREQVADTTLVAEAAEEGEPSTPEADDTGRNGSRFAGLGDEDILEEKIRWRMRRDGIR